MKCIILAGGKGKRFVPHKGFLKFGSGSLIQNIIKKLSSLFSEFYLVVNDKESYKSEEAFLVKDKYPDKGPLGGIYSGLLAANCKSFFCACDMPFINIKLVELMIENSSLYDVVVPYHKGKPEPLHAIYSPVCLEHIDDNLNKNCLKVISFYDRVKVCELRDEAVMLDPDGLSFFNINTEADFIEAKKIMASESRNNKHILVKY